MVSGSGPELVTFRYSMDFFDFLESKFGNRIRTPLELTSQHYLDKITKQIVR